MNGVLAVVNKTIEDVRKLAEEAYHTDGDHHKKWFLGQILEKLDAPPEDRYDEVAP